MTMADTIAVMNHGVIEQLGAPADLYERPVTTFVANFLGQSNLLAGTITGRDGDHLVIDVEGTTVRVPQDRSASQTGAVWFGVRPEKIALRTDGQPGAGNQLSGVVTDTSFTGVSTQYLVKVPWGQEVMVVQQNDGTPPLPPGEQVTMHWAPVHGFALDSAQDVNTGSEVDDEAVEAVGAPS